MVALSKARHVVVPTPLRDLLMQQTHAGLKNVSILAPEEIWPVKGSDERIPPPVRSEDPAVVQFSSGSTGEPRGICLTHRNILSNVRAFAERMRVQPDDMVVTWLPLYHDMGLIGTMIAPLATGVPLALLPPTDFLRQPSFWLRVMAKYNATISVAPQFAYSLCARKVHTGTLDGVDLSSVRILLNGAEPIQAHAVRRFERTFAPLGMRRNVVTPCYGLGEGTLAVSMVHPRKGLRVETIRPEVGKVPGSHERRRGVPVVSAGPPMSGTEVRVLGPRDSWQPDGRIGEICVRSPSVCRGYLTPEGMIPAVDDRGWLRTGDLGFVLDGEVFVTGRKKDLIIIGGRNLYPQDIEEEAAKINGVRLGRVAAFGIREPKRGTEGLVVLAEANGKDSASPFTANQIRRQILHRFAVSAYDIVLLGRGQIPVTTSGKLRRAQAKQSYLEGQLGEVLYQLHAGGASA
jgi:acyl-CoA synthetase (AMP-forming)/AMP-acid ligase II